MKKGIGTLTVVLAVGLAVSAVSAYAVGCGGHGGGYGMRGVDGGYAANVNDADYKKFMDETAALRKAIVVDRAELDALMAGKEPDAKKVRELTATIVDNQEKVAGIARAANINGPGTFGCGGNGPGANGGGCQGGNGPGNGRCR